MKKIIFTMLIILVFVVGSVIVIFKLPDNNADNKQIRIAVVNEDEGATVNDKYISFGHNFSESFQVDSDYNYDVTSRTKAFNGLDERVYDIVLVVPNSYTRDLLTYKEKLPQNAMIEYHSNSNSKQVEYLKGKVIIGDVEKMVNKTMVSVYSKEIMSSFHNMQKKSQKILEGQQKYNDSFDEKIKDPMNDTYNSIDNIMSESESQQSSISTFGSSVSTFKSNIGQRKNEEETQKLTIDSLIEQNKNTKKLLETNKTDINSLLSGMENNKATGTLNDMYKIVQNENLKIDDMMQSLESALNDFKGELKKIKDNHKVLKWKEYIYEQFSILASVNGTDFLASDVGYPSNISEAEKASFDAIKVEEYNSFITNGNLSDLINSVSSSGVINDAIENININGPRDVKEKIESTINTKCNELISSGLNTDDIAYKYCRPSSNGRSTKESLNIYTNILEKTYEDIDENESLLIDTSKIVDGYVTSILVDGVEYNSNSKNIEVDVTSKNKVKIQIELNTTGNTKNSIKSKDSIILQVDDQVESYKINNYYLTTYSHSTELYKTLETLVYLYYGRDLSGVVNGANSELLASDKDLNLTGIQVYRTKYENNSLIKKIEYGFDKDILKKEIINSYATSYKDIYKKQAEDLNDYLSSLNAIYESINSDYDDLKKANETLNKFLKDFESFYSEYSDMIDQLITIKQTQTNTIDSNEKEAKITVSLSEKQVKLIKGFTSLEKTIAQQEKQVTEIQKAAKKFEKNVDKMQKETKVYQKNVDKTQNEFISLTKKNEKYVDNFLKQYQNSKIKGQDNSNFYDNVSNPVSIESDDDSYNVGSLIPFYLILLLSIFSLIISYFVSNLQIKDVSKSDFVHDSRYRLLNKYVLILIALSTITGLITCYIGLQALDFSITNMMLWITIILVASIVLSYLFFALLYRFKTLGLVLIGAMLIVYFVTNSALGLSTTSLSIFGTFKNINPLILYETLIQSIVANQEANLIMLFIMTVVIASLATIIIYLPQKRLDTYEKI